MNADTISQIFGAIGYTVVQAKISPPTRPGVDTCAATVQFQSADEAQSVMQTFNGTTLPGFSKPLNISYANQGGSGGGGAAALAAGLAAAMMASGGGGKGGYGKAPAAKFGMQGGMAPYAPKKSDPDNLYIKGLPGTADEAFVEQVFNQYGTVRQVKILRKGDGPNCHAMVRFASAEDAATVMSTLNGGMLEGFNQALEISPVVYKQDKSFGMMGLMGGGGGVGSYDPETEAMLDEWVKAKRTRDYNTADAIKATLKAQGINPDDARPKAW